LSKKAIMRNWSEKRN